MRAIIVDDERLARVELRRLLEKHPDIQIVGEAGNADIAQRKISELKPDLLFLDIQMPGRNGFELLQELDEVPTVIFVTAYDEYALKAFEVNASDYLVKPVDPERLALTLKRVLRKPVARELRGEEPPVLRQNDQVFIREGERYWFVKLKDVSLLESEGNYTRVYFGEERPLILRSLQVLEERLDPAVFFRANRRQIVNLEWVRRLDCAISGNIVAYLTNGSAIEMSRRHSQRLRELKSI